MAPRSRPLRAAQCPMALCTLAGEWGVCYFSPQLPEDIFSLYIVKDTLCRMKNCLQVGRVESGVKNCPHPTHRPASLWHELPAELVRSPVSLLSPAPHKKESTARGAAS